MWYVGIIDDRFLLVSSCVIPLLGLPFSMRVVLRRQVIEKIGGHDTGLCKVLEILIPWLQFRIDGGRTLLCYLRHAMNRLC